MEKNLLLNNYFTHLGLGTSKIASLGTALSQRDINELINLSFEINVRVLDTANTYGSGDAERMIGKAIGNKREEFFIITKAGFPYMSLPGFFSPLNQIGKKIIQKTSPKKKFSKAYLINALEDSLKRLKTDSVNAFLLHEPTFTEIESEECWLALEAIKKSGKAQFTGVSTNDLKVLEKGVSTNTIEIVQTSVTFQPGFSNPINQFCVLHKIPIVANQILGSLNLLKNNNAFLSILNKYDKKENDIIDVLICYLIYKLQIDCILIGTRSKKHLAENANALDPGNDLEVLFQEMEIIGI